MVMETRLVGHMCDRLDCMCNGVLLSVSTLQVSAHQKKGLWCAIAKDVCSLGVYGRQSTHCWKRWEDLRRWARKTAEAQLGMAFQRGRGARRILTPLMAHILAVAYPELDGRLRESQQPQGASSGGGAGAPASEGAASQRTQEAEPTDAEETSGTEEHAQPAVKRKKPSTPARKGQDPTLHTMKRKKPMTPVEAVRVTPPPPPVVTGPPPPADEVHPSPPAEAAQEAPSPATTVQPSPPAEAAQEAPSPATTVYPSPPPAEAAQEVPSPATTAQPSTPAEAASEAPPPATTVQPSPPDDTVQPSPPVKGMLTTHHGLL
ncbi:hypothetical protein NDU88_003895 [Pleurodeles waltl]|uniref:Uncharacterized protein n=1 Tax=Pleurodeles waltl TaxID=8319 RepID=A0AAV7WTS2_PLEWA|nr:hypothetical protein NDU88_003895 [Pleurodeles waltl]